MNKEEKRNYSVEDHSIEIILLNKCLSCDIIESQAPSEAESYSEEDALFLEALRHSTYREKILKILYGKIGGEIMKREKYYEKYWYVPPILSFVGIIISLIALLLKL